MTLDPDLMPPVLVGVAGVTVGISSFFWFSHDVQRKRRWWPSWIIVLSALFVAFAWLFGGILAGLFMLVGSLFIGWLNIKRVKFCGQCGRMVASVQLFGPPAQYCPGCGESLDV